MVQLLTAKYNKAQEDILVSSNFLGVFVGGIGGLVISYLIGSFSNFNLTVNSITLSIIFALKLDFVISPLSWAITSGMCIRYLRKNGNGEWKKEFAKMIPGTLLFPLAVAYAFAVMGLVVLPLYVILLPYIGNAALDMYLGLLIFFPFMAFGVAVLLPESPAGRVLRTFIHRLQSAA